MSAKRKVMKPVCQRGSANWHQVALMKWAMLSGVNIGQKGDAGWVLFVEPGLVYVVEHRGPGFPPVRFEFPAWFGTKTFNGKTVDRWFWRSARSIAVRKAIKVFQALKDGSEKNSAKGAA